MSEGRCLHSTLKDVLTLVNMENLENMENLIYRSAYEQMELDIVNRNNVGIQVDKL